MTTVIDRTMDDTLAAPRRGAVRRAAILVSDSAEPRRVAGTHDRGVTGGPWRAAR
jgi:hypothetical protein